MRSAAARPAALDTALAPPAAPLQALLEAGDLLLLSGPARYDWAHAIRGVEAEEYSDPGWVPMPDATSAPWAASRALPQPARAWAAAEGPTTAADVAATAAGEADVAAGAGGGGVGVGGCVGGQQGGGGRYAGGLGSQPPHAQQQHQHQHRWQQQQQRVVRSKRVSVTLRKLCADIVLTEAAGQA
jgi:hypothetical protein